MSWSAGSCCEQRSLSGLSRVRMGQDDLLKHTQLRTANLTGILEGFLKGKKNHIK